MVPPFAGTTTARPGPTPPGDGRADRLRGGSWLAPTGGRAPGMRCRVRKGSSEPSVPHVPPPHPRRPRAASRGAGRAASGDPVAAQLPAVTPAHPLPRPSVERTMMGEATFGPGTGATRPFHVERPLGSGLGRRVPPLRSPRLHAIGMSQHKLERHACRDPVGARPHALRRATGTDTPEYGRRFRKARGLRPEVPGRAPSTPQLQGSHAAQVPGSRIRRRAPVTRPGRERPAGLPDRQGDR